MTKSNLLRRAARTLQITQHGIIFFAQKIGCLIQIVFDFWICNHSKEERSSTIRKRNDRIWIGSLKWARCFCEIWRQISIWRAGGVLSGGEIDTHSTLRGLRSGPFELQLFVLTRRAVKRRNERLGPDVFYCIVIYYFSLSLFYKSLITSISNFERLGASTCHFLNRLQPQLNVGGVV